MTPIVITIGDVEFRGGTPAENLAAVDAAESECREIQGRADAVWEMAAAEFRRWVRSHPAAPPPDRVEARRRLMEPGRLARSAALAAWDSLYSAILPPGAFDAPQA